MLKSALALGCMLVVETLGHAQSRQVPVEVVATATEYIAHSPAPHTRQSERSYTTCSGDSSYVGTFTNVDLSCTTTTKVGSDEGPYTTLAKGVTNATGGGLLTGSPKKRYTVLRSEDAVYLFSCTEHWRWSKCPVLGIGDKYFVEINRTVLLEDPRITKPLNVEYLSSASLPPTTPQASLGANDALHHGVVHISSAPSGGEILIDGKFYGNAPSDVSLPAGEHVVKVTSGNLEWTRKVEITSGDITIHAEMVAASK